MLSRKGHILNLYFNEKLRTVDIAEELEISKSAVSQVLNKDVRYKKEKESRKQKNKEKNNEYTKKYMKTKRKSGTIDMEYEYMKLQHNQAITELSNGRNNINNRAFRKWNSSAYKFNKNKNCFEFDKKLIRSYAVPKYIR